MDSHPIVTPAPSLPTTDCALPMYHQYIQTDTEHHKPLEITALFEILNDCKWLISASVNTFRNEVSS